MLVSVNWLQEYVDIGQNSPEKLAEKITKSGVEVEGVKYIGKPSKDVVIGYVKSCEEHPHANKLSVCQVDTGKGTLQIVCGAANIRSDVNVAVALPNAVLPGDFKIQKVSLRDVESNGMICSLDELGFSEEHIPKAYQEGIYIFPDSVPVGEPVESFLNMNDAVLELDLTPNRADCLNMIGLAYETSAILNSNLHLPDTAIETLSVNVNDEVKAEVLDPDICPYYSLFMLENITVKPSPLWMQNYLLAAGIRPINNVVDITNYVLMEYGQPLHAFDYHRINSDRIVVRSAKDGEKLTTLDDKERSLNSDNLVITDGKDPIALAGVMGGANTEVHEGTTSILLEAALFSPVNTRRTVEQTGLRSEASTRYEKGIDPDRVEAAGLRACQLLKKYAGANIYAGVSESNHLDKDVKKVEMNTNTINKRLGTSITTREIKAILKRLCFSYQVEQESFTVEIPSRRGDISIFEDMLEEIARIYGYDQLKYTLPYGETEIGGLTVKQSINRSANRYLQAAGLMETKTYSLIDEERINMFLSPEVQAIDPKPIQMAKPISTDHQFLRTSLLPEILQSVSYNTARNETNVAYYEIGKVYITNEEPVVSQPEEKQRLAGAMTGDWIEHPWQNETKSVDFYVVKGIVEGLLDHLNVPITIKQDQLDHMHPGRCATVYINDQVIGFMGQVHPPLADKWDLNETYVFDIDMDRCLEHYTRTSGYQPIPKYPSIERDIAFIMDESIEAGAIKGQIETLGAPLVKHVHIFDVYQGENLPDGKKSIAYSLVYRDSEKTLTDEEIDASYQDIIKTINDTYGTYVRD